MESNVCDRFVTKFPESKNFRLASIAACRTAHAKDRFALLAAEITGSEGGGFSAEADLKHRQGNAWNHPGAAVRLT